MIKKPIRPDSPFITDLLDSLGRRSKPLKHKNAFPLIQRFIDTQQGLSEERIEIAFRIRNRQTLTLTAWEDRTIRVHVAESIWQAGWKFQYTCVGRFIGLGGGREIVRAIEATLSTMSEMTSDNVAQLDCIWDPLLAKGPQPL